jgi:class 3 adenylate cyclase
MTSKNSVQAVLFADISGSTRLFETLGDEVARHKIAKCLEMLGEVITAHKGTLIKTIGDEVMCTFATADAAAQAACEMQAALEEAATEYTATGPLSLRIRVGFHYGPVMLENNDVFGDTVNVAARMAALAKAGQIITTQQTIDVLSTQTRPQSRLVDRAPVKGKKEAIDICELVWQQEDITRFANSTLLSKPAESNMFLTYRDRSICVNAEKSSVVMGRSVNADLAVEETLASRQHAKIDYRRGKFFLIDQSTNGTYVKTDDGVESFLRREEAPIAGSGVISLGKPFKQNPSEIVRFRAE